MDAQQVRALREQLAMSQVTFAAAIMVHPMTVSKWERGTAAPLPIYARAMRILARKNGVVL